jgi:hypothetical protein
MNIGYRTPNVKTPPRWMGDYTGRDTLVPYPIRVNPDLFNDAAAVPVKLSAIASAGTNEVQTITIDATGGTFTVTYAGQTTAAVAYNAAAGTLEDALEALSNIAPGDVQVTKAGSVFTLTFGGTLGKQNIAPVTTDASSLTGGAGTAAVATTTPGVAAATTLAVDALTGPVPAGAVLRFGTGMHAYVTADAATGDTSITVEAITADIADNSTAYYSQFNRKYIPSGTLIGRTYTERDANAAWGPAAHTDDEFLLTAFDIIDASVNPDAEGYRNGKVVKENYLPLMTRERLSGDADLLTKLRASYVCINGTD